MTRTVIKFSREATGSSESMAYSGKAMNTGNSPPTTLKKPKGKDSGPMELQARAERDYQYEVDTPNNIRQSVRRTFRMILSYWSTIGSSLNASALSLPRAISSRRNVSFVKIV